MDIRTASETKGAPVDVLAVLREVRLGRSVSPHIAAAAEGSARKLFDAAQLVCDNGSYEDFVALRDALVRAGGAL